jgi:hypothetical protein
MTSIIAATAIVRTTVACHLSVYSLTVLLHHTARICMNIVYPLVL